MGRYKMAALGFVRDRVVKRLQGWKGKLLPQSGKETLIKSIAFAIPTYYMGCFAFPKKWFDSLNSTIANFWWGQQDDERKLH